MKIKYHYEELYIIERDEKMGFQIDVRLFFPPRQIVFILISGMLKPTKKPIEQLTYINV